MKFIGRKPSNSDRRNQPTRWSGLDIRTRLDRALALGRGYEAVGDKVEAERFYQQADHYRRLLNNRAA